jgi:hypothetical protein
MNAARRPPIFSCCRKASGNSGKEPEMTITSYGGVRRPGLGRVAGFNADVGHPCLLAGYGPGGVGEERIDLDAIDILGLGRQKGGHMATPGTDLKHDVGVPDRHFLENARLDLRLQHGLAVADRQLEVGKRQHAW